jgi:ion channel-forming bestrophin family protein
MSLRGERELESLIRLLGDDEAASIIAARHMPSAVAGLIANGLRDARDRRGLDGFAFLRIDRDRSALIDDIGGCERIQKTPLPRAYRVEIRRVLILFIAASPFALVDRIAWMTPIATILVALPLLALDRVGTELQEPFALDSLNHLPLDEICETIEGDLLTLLDQPTPPTSTGPMS